MKQKVGALKRLIRSINPYLIHLAGGRKRHKLTKLKMKRGS
jgi:hypothetical protein